MSIILKTEAQERQGSSCEVCNEAKGVIQCKSCIRFHGWCKPCTVKVHKHLPFHQ
ncbi:hypothetical protein PAXRUDRAFT_180079, partial [Paxillus rubicundulus Ve08.2h10]